MHSKNKKPITANERRHVEKVKSLPCSVCDAPPPSEAHEIKQGQWYTSISLCPDCHRDGKNGLHGQRVMWNIMKMDELDGLNVTLDRIFEMEE